MPGPAFTLALGLSALLAAGSAGCPPGIGEPIPSGAVPAMPAAGISYRDLPMTPRVVRDARPGCGDACAEWIAMEGRIMPGTGEAFAGMLRTLGARRLPVYVDSGGGAVDDAMAVGKLIRERHLDVAVAQTIPAQTSPDCAGCGPESALPRSPGAVCASACVLVLAAGTGRVVGLATHVGVHQMSMKGVRTVKRRMFRVFYRTVGGVRQEIGRRLLSERTLSSTAFSEPASRATDERVARYLDRMGIGAGLMPLMLSTPATGIRWLTPGEGRETSLFTASDGGETLLLRQRVALAPLANDAGGSSGPTLIGAASFEAAGAEPGQPASGKVAWTLEKPTLGLPILVATITIPTAGLALMLRIAPESTARAAPLVLDAVVKGGETVRHVQRLWPLHAGSVDLTGAPRTIGPMAWRLRLNGDAATLLAAPPDMLALRVMRDDGHVAELTFEAPERLAALVAKADRAWKTGAGSRNASASPPSR